MKQAARLWVLPLVVAVVALSGCSINRLAIQAVSGIFAGSGESTVFTGEEDPELVGDALPFALKLYESLLDADPKNPAMALATGRTFVTYAYAYVQMPADELEDTQATRAIAMRDRAKKLFVRARDYLMRGIELRRPGFRAAIERGSVDEALRLVRSDDIEYLYWLSAAWLSAFSVSPFDMELLVTIPTPVRLLQQVTKWSDTWSDGAAHGILLTFYGSAPADIGGSEQKAREEFTRLVEISKGLLAGPYVGLATTVSVKNQNAAEFRELLGKALAIDVNADPANRLVNIITQRHARWLLDHVGNFFISEGGEG